MKAFEPVEGRAVPFMVPNVDTDVIIRIDSSMEPAELRKNAFAAIRYTDGQPRADCVFNQPRYRDAPILLGGENFGCGSSRESAVAAIAALGVKVVIAPSFGDIFFTNCFRRGLLAIRLDQASIESIAAATDEGPIRVELAEQTIALPNGRVIRFDIDAILKELLTLGLDQIEFTSMRSEIIQDWQGSDKVTRPWAWL